MLVKFLVKSGMIIYQQFLYILLALIMKIDIFYSIICIASFRSGKVLEIMFS